MRLIFLGPPGAGKGTLAAKAVEILGIPHISTGAIFRTAIANASPLGLQIKATIEAGKLVDDETTINLVHNRLSRPDAVNGYILDGYPRTICQAEDLADYRPVDKVINFTLPEELILQRLGGRRVCRGCGYNFHVLFDKPKIETICDHCGGEIYTRDDDCTEAIQKRLEVYGQQTAPLIDFYRERNLLVDVDASGNIDQVVENFKKALGL